MRVSAGIYGVKSGAIFFLKSRNFVITDEFAWCVEPTLTVLPQLWLLIFQLYFFLQALETSCDFLASMRAQFLQLSAFSSQLVIRFVQ